MATLKELRQENKEQADYIQELEDRLAEINGLASLADEDEDDDGDDDDDE